MEWLILFVILYIIIFLLDYYILRKFHVNEFEYLKLRFKLKKSFKEPKSNKIISSLINSFIISSISTLAIYCKQNLLLTFVVAFALLLLLIYSLYGIYGNSLRSKQNEKRKAKSKKQRKK